MSYNKSDKSTLNTVGSSSALQQYNFPSSCSFLSMLKSKKYG